jgi:cytochrome bd-type quinol oxidase subunit 1
MEGLFKTETGAGLVLMGQPNEETGQIDNPLVVNNMLSFLIYGTTKAEVKGLDQIPHDQWPTTLPLLYYAYHIMAGLGTWFVLLMIVSALLLWRRRLYTARWALWALLLSFLIYGTTKAEVKGLDQIPRDQWPTALPLLYYAYHIMAGLGTWFALLMVVSAFLLWRGHLHESRWALWALLLSFPLPYIANTAGWMTAELGRQPWLIYGLMRTSEGYSNTVSASNGLFTLIGFMGLYLLLGLLFTVLIYREISNGPEPNIIASAHAD